MVKIFQPIRLAPPTQGKRVLLHCCCAPCCGPIIESMVFSEIPFAIFFYNPNIHPEAEYNFRKKSLVQFALTKNVPFIDVDYEQDQWFNRISGFEHSRERGPRCEKCFDLRLERTALFAHQNGFPIFSSSLGIARWKDMCQVNLCGKRAAKKYPDLYFWDYNWRKNGGSEGIYQIAKKEEFYRQEYCGCIYSFMSTNLKRCQSGHGPIIIGSNFYTTQNQKALSKHSSTQVREKRQINTDEPVGEPLS